MTYSELKQAVMDLNDGENIEYGTAFVTAVNLGLGHIARIIPIEKEIRLTVEKPLYILAGTVKTSETYTVSDAGAVVFEARGSGRVKNGDTQLGEYHNHNHQFRTPWKRERELREPVRRHLPVER